jgi:N-acetyl-1-D-myo-inositol-2-amino-2-deoxy-alpha-D-glucopyranoside deacetylase
MMGVPSNDREDCFWRADLVEVAAEMVALIRDRRPHVLVTYDEFGGYGHPDHIQAHRVAMYGAQLAAAPSFKPELGAAWTVDKIYWTAFPRSNVERARALMAERGMDFFSSDEPEDGTPWACPDEWITTTIEAFDLEPLKLEALLAHRTQITKDAPFLAISEAVGPAGLGTEHYRLVHGSGVSGSTESDLLEGVDLTR